MIVQKSRSASIIIAILGALVAFAVINMSLERAEPELAKAYEKMEGDEPVSFLPSLISSAYAQSDDILDPVHTKPIIIFGIFALLGLAFLASVFMSFLSQPGPNQDRASEVSKTLITFFTGALTGVL